MLALTSNSSNFHLENKRKVLFLVRVSGGFSPISILKILKLMTLPDGGGAPEGRRERKIRQFLPEKIRLFRISRFGPAVSFTRKTFENPPYLSLSGSAAAPPSGGAKTWQPAERAGAGLLRAPSLPSRAIPGNRSAAPNMETYSLTLFDKTGFGANLAFDSGKNFHSRAKCRKKVEVLAGKFEKTYCKINPRGVKLA